MKRPLLKLPQKAKTAAQQGSDFTAEGAPPPGRVGLGPPVEDASPPNITARVTGVAHRVRQPAPQPGKAGAGQG
jgi:hypothetical protein